MTTGNSPLEGALTELLAYLAAAARGNVDEGEGYGPYRLLEAGVRLTRLMEAHGMGDPFLEAWAARVEQQAMALIASPEKTRATADELLSELAGRLSALEAPESGIAAEAAE